MTRARLSCGSGAVVVGCACFRLRADGAWSARRQHRTARASIWLGERWHTAQVAECGSHSRAALPLPSSGASLDSARSGELS